MASKAIIAVVALALMSTSSFSQEATFRVKRDKAHLQSGYAPIVASQPAYAAPAPAYQAAPQPQPQYPSTIPVPLPIPLAPSSIYLPRPPPQPAAPQYSAPAPYQAPTPQYQASAPAPQYQPPAPAAYSAPPPPPSYSAAAAPPPPAPYVPPVPPRPVSYAPAPAPASYAPPPPPPPPAQYAPAPAPAYAPAPAPAYAPAPAPAPAYAPAPAPAPAPAYAPAPAPAPAPAYAPAPAPAPAPAYAPAPAPAPAPAYAPAPAPAPAPAYAPAPAPAPAPAYAPAPAPAPAPAAYAPAPVAPAPAPVAYAPAPVAPAPAPAPVAYAPAPVAAPAQPQYAPAPLPAPLPIPAPYAAPAPVAVEVASDVAIASPAVPVVEEVAVVVTEAPAVVEVDTGSYSAAGPVTVPPVIEDATSAPSDAFPELTENDIRIKPVPVPEPVAAAPVAVEGAKAPEKSQWSEGSIPSVLEKMGLNTLNDLLILAELDETLDKGGPFTVFVPLDQAFELLIQRFGGMEVAEKQFNENPEVLTSLLKHHVVSGVIPSTALQQNMVVPSLLQTPLRIKFYESEKADWTPLKVVTVNGARVLRPDIQAKNGIIHIVDRVIFPVPQADIYNTLKGDKEQRYSTFISAVERAGLVPLLANPQAGPYTVFAPTNKAFSLLSPSELNAILSDQVRLTNLIKRHIVQDLIYTSGLQGFQKAYALDFELLFIYHAKGMTKVNGANVVDQDLTTLNGVVHTIDSVLGL